MGFEVLEGYFGCILTMTTGRDELVLHFVVVGYELFHGFGNFVVQDVLLRDDVGVGTAEAIHNGHAGAGELGIFVAFKLFNEDAVAVNIHEDHDISIVQEGARRKLACLIGEDSFVDVVDGSEDVALLLPAERTGVAFLHLQGAGALFGRANIFASLGYMPLRGLLRLGLVFLDIADGEEWPAHVITCFDCLEPSGLDRVAANGMHPPYGLFGGREIVHAVGLTERSASASVGTRGCQVPRCWISGI